MVYGRYSHHFPYESRLFVGLKWPTIPRRRIAKFQHWAVDVKAPTIRFVDLKRNPWDFTESWDMAWYHPYITMKLLDI